MNDLDKASDRGNHKSEDSSPELLESLVTDEISHSYQALVPRDVIKLINNAVLVPYGISN